MAPVCNTLQFVDEFNVCQLRTSCSSYYKCGSDGGYYDDVLEGCYCNGVVSDPASYCDAECEDNVLKAYFTNDRMIKLEAGNRSRKFALDTFGDELFLEGMSCPAEQCQIVSLAAAEDGS